ncbi:MAG: DUF3144 domain-containing protein [Betaproteobacteria bacterium]|nr:DUF3144 domain-containing protein [Betaproteobacteria bacterium]
MSTPSKEDAQQFFEISNQFVTLANELGEDHGRPRVSAAVLWAASRYNAFTWVMSGAPEKQTPEEAVEIFVAQYRKMLAENLKLMREEFGTPPK